MRWIIACQCSLPLKFSAKFRFCSWHGQKIKLKGSQSSGGGGGEDITNEHLAKIVNDISKAFEVTDFSMFLYNTRN